MHCCYHTNLTAPDFQFNEMPYPPLLKSQEGWTNCVQVEQGDCKVNGKNNVDSININITQKF